MPFCLSEYVFKKVKTSPKYYMCVEHTFQKLETIVCILVTKNYDIDRLMTYYGIDTSIHRQSYRKIAVLLSFLHMF